MADPTVDQILHGVETYARQVSLVVSDVVAHKLPVTRGLDLIDDQLQYLQQQRGYMSGRRGEMLDPVIDFCRTARTYIQRMAS